MLRDCPCSTKTREVLVEHGYIVSVLRREWIRKSFPLGMEEFQSFLMMVRE